MLRIMIDIDSQMTWGQLREFVTNASHYDDTDYVNVECDEDYRPTALEATMPHG